jgi:DNA-directed RNA polymerase subunit M/transcription elongation factor TFIIS
MQTATATAWKSGDPDIFFHCEKCNAALVANQSAGGMILSCQRCGKSTAVPTPPEPSAAAMAQLQEIQRKLTENESQRTEVTGYINQVSIQLHRWQLRLQTLNERKQQLEKELVSQKT